jgi:hypothetical protein
MVLLREVVIIIIKINVINTIYFTTNFIIVAVIVLY